MSLAEIISYIVIGLIGIVLVTIGIFMLKGKGSFLIAGYNTLPETKKNEYDEKKLTRYVGVFVLINAILLVLLSLAIRFRKMSLIIVYVVIVFLLTIVMIIMTNTKYFFKKQ